ncbi:carotenoid oxygenase family protein [Chromobacterium vaccinii]|uniref:Carotenoid oxygenase family protein n=1 Tax=Chromobacterium vaccinii TaxID=1108595 RepID=A0ABV0FEP2_9NEIS
MDEIDLNSGALAPVTQEMDLIALRVTGKIPDDLNGMLVRNGPNPLSGRFEGVGLDSWWPEAAMLHAITFDSGRVVGYRNRWLRTQRWARTYSPGNESSCLETNPNINVISHAGEIYALAEGGAPLTISATLDTLGGANQLAGFAAGMTGHPKIDHSTGELVTFRADWKQPYLRYGVIDNLGQLVVDTEIEMPSPSMMHDMAITETHSIFLDLNVGYDFSMLGRGHRLPLRWRDEHCARLGVIPRQGGDVRWFEISPCCILHVVNAFNEDEKTIVLDVVRYPWFMRMISCGESFDANPAAVLWRYRIDVTSGIVHEAPVCDYAMEFPRVNEKLTGRPYRYVYAVEQPTLVELRGIIRYDWHSGTIARYVVPPGDHNSEPVFVPRQGAETEDDGWLLCCVYRQLTDTSDVVVLDARNIASGPVATVHLPTRIPAGFHGAWLSS